MAATEKLNNLLTKANGTLVLSITPPFNKNNAMLVSVNGSKLIQYGNRSYSGIVTVSKINSTAVSEVSLNITVITNSPLVKPISVVPANLSISQTNASQVVTKVKIQVLYPVSKLTASFEGFDLDNSSQLSLYLNGKARPFQIQNLTQDQEVFLFVGCETANITHASYEGVISISYSSDNKNYTDYVPLDIKIGSAPAPSLPSNQTPVPNANEVASRNQSNKTSGSSSA